MSKFGEPKENWSKLPHVLTDEYLSQFTSLSELKVVLYILRHTWGYHEEYKRITIDEFANGRKKKDGARMDTGCGMSENAIRDGLKRAIAHEFIFMHEDASDAARIKRYYSLDPEGFDRMNAGAQPLSLEKSGVQLLNPWGAEVEPLPSEVEAPTTGYKETIRKKQTERQASSSVVAYENGFGPITPVVAQRITEAVEKYGEQIVVEAIETAVESGGRSWKYVEGILSNWATDGKRKRGQAANAPRPSNAPVDPSSIVVVDGVY